MNEGFIAIGVGIVIILILIGGYLFLYDTLKDKRRTKENE